MICCHLMSMPSSRPCYRGNRFTAEDAEYRIRNASQKTFTAYMVRPALQGESFIGSKGKLRTYIRPLIEA